MGKETQRSSASLGPGPPGLGEDKVGLRLGFCSQTELSHLVVDETSGTGDSLCFPSNKPVQLLTASYVWVPKSFACDSVEESYLHWQHRAQVLAQGHAAQVQIPLTSKAVPQLPHHSTGGTRPGEAPRSSKFVIECIHAVYQVKSGETKIC